jgi:hypothetical protein
MVFFMVGRMSQGDFPINACSSRINVRKVTKNRQACAIVCFSKRLPLANLQASDNPRKRNEPQMNADGR